MVTGLSIFFMAISLLIGICFPIGLAIYFYKKDRVSISVIFLGALTFTVFQILTRIPILNYIQSQQWFIEFSSNFALLWIFLGLTAGVFEELGRFIMYKLFMKKKLSRSNAIAFGIGHGGIEAVLLLSIPMVNNIVLSIMINNGIFAEKIAPTLPLAQAIQIKNALTSTAPYMFAMGGIERILAIVIQIAFSVLVMYGVKTGKFRYVVYAILAHMLVDTPIGFLSKAGVGIWGIEAFVAVCAMIGYIYIKKSKQTFKSLEPVEEVLWEAKDEEEQPV